MKLTIPIVNINGTDGLELLAKYEAAGHALQESMRLLDAAAPNPRDYGAEAYGKARKEHEDRAARLRQVFEEIRTIYTDIAF